MKEITTDKLFELYEDAIDKCGSYLLEEDDKTIEYNVFEEFDIGVHSFLHKDNLNLLYEKGFISKNKMDKSLKLRDRVIQLQKLDEWNINSLRTSEKWRDVFSLCDELKALK